MLTPRTGLISKRYFRGSIQALSTTFTFLTQPPKNGDATLVAPIDQDNRLHFYFCGMALEFFVDRCFGRGGRSYFVRGAAHCAIERDCSVDLFLFGNGKRFLDFEQAPVGIQHGSQIGIALEIACACELCGA